MKVLAGFDLGTTGCRCLLFDEKLNVLGESYYEYALNTAENGVAEQNAEDWCRLLVRALAEAAERAGCSPQDVCSVGMSSQGITTVPVDSGMRPLGPAINWLDSRPDTGADELLFDIGVQQYRDITARLTPNPYGIAKVLWLRRHRTDIASQTYKYLMPLDFMTAWLCGRAVTDHSMAAGMGCYDMTARGWSKSVLDAAHIDASMLADIAVSGSIAGYITEAAAKETGLAQGTPVAVGAQDQKCGALAAGLREGVATVSMGTCTAMIIHSDKAMLNEQDYIPCFADLFGSGYMLESCINVGAGCLKWYRDLFMPQASYADVCSLAALHSPTEESPMFFPHLSGMSTPKRWENCPGSFYGLRLNTDAAGMAHSVLESIAFSLRQNIEAAGRLTGAQTRLLRVFGGGAKSAEWLGIISDVTGLRIETLTTHEMCCQGAAMLAALAAGITIPSASERVKDIFIPHESTRDVYDARYALYNKREERIYKKAAEE